MAWTVLWSLKSVRQLKKLDRKQVQMIRDALLETTEDPFAVVRRLSNSIFYRMRVGDYRIIMDLQQGTMIIFVVEIGHRKRIYG